MQITAAAAFSHLGLRGRRAGPKPCPDRGHRALWQGSFLPKTPITPSLLWLASQPKAGGVCLLIAKLSPCSPPTSVCGEGLFSKALQEDAHIS